MDTVIASLFFKGQYFLILYSHPVTKREKHRLNHEIPLYISSSSSIHTASMDFPDSLFLFICLYHPSFPASLPDYILCLHRAVAGKFLLVCQYWRVHILRSIGECHRTLYPNFCLHWVTFSGSCQCQIKCIILQKRCWTLSTHLFISCWFLFLIIWYYLLIMLQYSSSSEEYGVSTSLLAIPPRPTNLKWSYLLGSHLWIKYLFEIMFKIIMNYFCSQNINIEIKYQVFIYVK